MQLLKSLLDLRGTVLGVNLVHEHEGQVPLDYFRLLGRELIIRRA
jgi:hypothetical protein